MMNWTTSGQLVAELGENSDSAALDLICPFSDLATDETILGAAEYARVCPRHDGMLGWYIGTYVGYVSDVSLRERSSSGGLGRWLLGALLRGHHVDYCIHVAQCASDEAGGPLFEYRISSTAEEVYKTARSAYYPVHMGAVLREVVQRPGRYVITGVPCFIKAVRLLQRQNELIRERIRFTLGLFCGHLKSRLFAEMLAWQLGVGPDCLRWIEFRDKKASQNAKQKGVVVRGCDGQPPRGPEVVSSLFGAEYGLGFFQYEACDFCDDVAAETADVVVGDAWLPEYIADPRGTSLVIVRHPKIAEILQQGCQSGELALQWIPPERVVDSQAGAFRHRREGLAYRLYLANRARRWYPPKRVTPGWRHLDSIRRRIYRLRIRLREESGQAFQAAKRFGDFAVFRRRMEPLVARYRRLYMPRLLHRFLRRLRRAWHLLPFGTK